MPAGFILYTLILCYLYKLFYVQSGMNATEEVRHAHRNQAADRCAHLHIRLGRGSRAL